MADTAFGQRIRLRLSRVPLQLGKAFPLPFFRVYPKSALREAFWGAGAWPPPGPLTRMPCHQVIKVLMEGRSGAHLPRMRGELALIDPRRPSISREGDGGARWAALKSLLPRPTMAP